MRKRVIVVEYDPGWPERFESLAAPIRQALLNLDFEIEHVGSTSVPGLAAKPIIDMTIVLQRPEEMPILIEKLADLGYQHRGDLGISGREAFRASEHLPSHHLYACVQGNLALQNHLTLRNHLRQNPQAVQEYAALKKTLAERFSDDIDGYVDGKTAFILGVLKQADFETDALQLIQTVNQKPD